MPRTPHTWGGAAALWVTVAGWIAAEERRGGTPVGVLTPGGVIGVDECLAATTTTTTTTTAAAPTVPSVRRLPPSLRQAARAGQREVIRFGVLEDRTIVAPMGVDANRFSPDADGSTWRERVRSVGDFVIVWSGSLRRFHHLDIALQALRRLRDEGCAAGLVIAGDGQDRKRLTQVAADLGVSDWVDFVGQISTLDMPSLLSCGDAAVVTAGADQAFHYSPLKLREYLAMALPVVAADVGEIGRVIENGRSGLLYEPGDVAGLAAGLRRLAEDDELRARVGEAGRQRVLESWTWDEITRRCVERLPR